MARITVIDLAKELGYRSADLMQLAEAAGIHIARMAATLTQPQADEIRAYAERNELKRQNGVTVVRPKDWQERVTRSLDRAEERRAERERLAGRLGHMRQTLGDKVGLACR